MPGRLRRMPPAPPPPADPDADYADIARLLGILPTGSSGPADEASGSSASDPAGEALTAAGETAAGETAAEETAAGASLDPADDEGGLRFDKDGILVGRRRIPVRRAFGGAADDEDGSADEAPPRPLRRGPIVIGDPRAGDARADGEPPKATSDAGAMSTASAAFADAPTAEPPTAEPPTAEPPTAEPPTAEAGVPPSGEASEEDDSLSAVGLTPARRAALPPPLSALRPGGTAPPRREPPPLAHDPRVAEMLAIEAGTFLYGEYGEDQHLHAFEIDRYPVTNRDFEAFVQDTGHRPPLYWEAGQFPDELADHPVVGVDYYDAMAFARWAGKDLPFEDEWERAARGRDGRTYPWGDDQDPDGANTSRTGLQMTSPVSLWRNNVSPDGMADVVGNAWELTHSPAAGGGVVVRGGSWYDFALYAKTFFRFATAPDHRNGTIGFRCVRRSISRDEEPREVDPVYLDGEISARLGARARDRDESLQRDRRDLIPDLTRLSIFLAEMQADTFLKPLIHHAPTEAWTTNPVRPTGMDLPAASAEEAAAAEQAAREAQHVLSAGRAPGETPAEQMPSPADGSAAEEDAAAHETIPGWQDGPRITAAHDPRRDAHVDVELVGAAPERNDAVSADPTSAGAAPPASVERHTEGDAESEEEKRVEVVFPQAGPLAEPLAEAEQVGASLSGFAPPSAPPAERETLPPLHVTDVDLGEVASQRNGTGAMPPASSGTHGAASPGLRFGFGRPQPPAATQQPAAPPAPLRTATPPAGAPHAGTRAPGASEGRMPWPLWLLLGLGFLLLGGLLIAMLSGHFGSAPDEVDPQAEAPRQGRTDAGLEGGSVAKDPSGDHDLPHAGVFNAPTYGQGARDNDEPRVMLADRPSHAAAIQQGVWLLVFADPTTDAGRETIRRTHTVQRAMVSRHVEVALVLPRSHYTTEGGWLPDKRALREQLQTLGIWDGMSVIMDPAVSKTEPRGVLHTKYGRRGRSVSAALLFRGGRESRAAAPKDTALSMEKFVTLLERGLELAKL